MQIAYRNEGGRANWYALYLSAKKQFSSDKALQEMGLSFQKRSVKKRKPKAAKPLNCIEIREHYESGMTMNKLKQLYHVDGYRLKAAIIEAGGTVNHRGRKSN